MAWLIQEETRQRLTALIAAHGAITAEEQREHEARSAARRANNNGPPNLSISGSVAEIRVEGLLTQKPDFWAWLLGIGNTTYEEIQQAISIALAESNVQSVRMVVDSPGGEVSGLFDTFASIEELRAAKPTSVRAINAHSAAYGISAVAGPIEAQNAASMFGSVGVAASFYTSDRIIDLTNTESPDKRPDLNTEEGRAVVVRELDALFELFVDSIARGRDTSTEKVVSDFGRGASFVAAEAQKRGMIDSIAKPALRAVAPPTSAAKQDVASAPGRRKASGMTPEDLRVQHRETYDAVMQLGVNQERDRVVAHVTMGETCGDMAIATEAIRSGDAMTQTLTARYLAAAVNRKDRSTRQDEAEAAKKATEGANATAEQQGDLGDQVAAIMAERRGQQKKAG